MAYSKSYQTVVAGRVREDEMPFFRQNRIAAPPNTFIISSIGGQKQPTITLTPLEDVNVGKKDNRTQGDNAYLPGSYNCISQ